MKLGPLITLTTDFGSSDHYVGTMKGVLLKLCPAARLVDISHELPPFAIEPAAYTIEQAAPYFPAATIHIIVVDPGVGTSRRPILVEALDQHFIAPDNGVLSLILNRDTDAKVREISNRTLFLDSPSHTFHGRDIFAPVAAALANGTKAEALGPPVADAVRLARVIPRHYKNGIAKSIVLSIDRFGNIITGFRSSEFANAKFSLRIGKRQVVPHHATFGEAPKAEVFTYFGSSGYIEIGMNQASAAQSLNAQIGQAVTLRARNA